MSKTKYRVMIGKLISVKSKFEQDFIRFSLDTGKPISYDNFKNLLAKRHNIHSDFDFFIECKLDKEVLQINDDNNLEKALIKNEKLLRIFIHRKEDIIEDTDKCDSLKRKGKTCAAITSSKHESICISDPTDFRQVCAIIDVDILPKTCRRVRLLKHKLNKPLGFFVKEGRSYRAIPLSAGGGIEEVRGVFISQLIDGGLAKSTGLLTVGDEVLEINGINVLGKSLEQVTDMMLANASNLIITIKPMNERAEGDTLSNYSRSSIKSCCSAKNEEILSAENEDENLDQVFYV